MSDYFNIKSLSIANELISVQPLNAPVGKIFYTETDSIAERRRRAIEKLFKLYQ